MNLELKHLAAYLPYNVNYIINGESEIIELKSIDFGIKMVNFGWGNAKLLSEIKLILHPLSDIENEIEHNGKKLTVRNLIDDVRRFIDVYQYLDQSYDIELNYETSDYTTTVDLFDGYTVVQILLEYHFDIFGLIPAGLAIDINTLER